MAAQVGPNILVELTLSSIQGTRCELKGVLHEIFSFKVCPMVLHYLFKPLRIVYENLRIYT